MKQFNGFPTKMQFTSIPNVFFSSLLPQIDDIAELKKVGISAIFGPGTPLDEIVEYIKANVKL